MLSHKTRVKDHWFNTTETEQDISSRIPYSAKEEGFADPNFNIKKGQQFEIDPSMSFYVNIKNRQDYFQKHIENGCPS